MCRRFPSFAVLGAIVVAMFGPQPAPSAAGMSAAVRVSWQTDYVQAVCAAREQGKMLLVLFSDPGWRWRGRLFRKRVLAAPAIQQRLQDYLCVEVPVRATVCIDGTELSLLEHGAFAPLQGGAGVAVLDFAHRRAPYYGYVVSALAFEEAWYPTVQQMATLLDLPAGSLEERWREYLARLGRGRSAEAAEPPSASRGEPPLGSGSRPEIRWLGDYVEAADQADREAKMLLIFFQCEAGQNVSCRRLERETLADPLIRQKLQDYVCLKVPLDAMTLVEGRQVTLLEHEAFREMLGQPGVAIVDFAHRDAPYHGRVTSTFPLTAKLFYTPQQMATILDLPPGTLTQRTLVYAVRTHPERPASTAGQFDPYLAQEAESHAQYQAAIRLQGHQQWETRFHRINAHLPHGLSAREVCAESWPGEPLVEAAIECVRCWRLSAGHWSAVRAQHHVYAYDMKRGRNGVWYATGIFGGG